MIGQGIEPNQTKQALKQGQPVLGTSVSLNVSPLIAEVLATAGFDYVLVDMEHTAVSMDTAAGLMSVAKHCGMTPLVRLPKDQFWMIQQALDSGAQGIYMPHVDHPAQAESIRRYAKYPPEGERGFLSRGPHTGFRRLKDPDWMYDSNQECLVVIMVESRTSVDNIDAILDTGAVDAVVVGPGDLSLSYGKPGQFSCPEVVEATHRVIASCKRHEVAAGTAVGTIEATLEWTRAGAQFFVVSTDLYMLLDVASAFVSGFQAKYGSSR